jgi:cell division septal protein FtsQ
VQGSFLLASLLVAYWGSRAALHAPVLRVNDIVVRGNVRLSTGEVLATVEGLRGASLLRADLEVWRRRLQASPWVRDAALRRVLPGTVEILITERTPMGVARIGSRLHLVDEAGAVIDEYGAQYAEFDLPIIDGLSGTSAGGADKAMERRAALASRVLQDVGRQGDLLARISQIDVRDERDAVVLLEGDPAFVHLGEERFLDRLRAYVEMADALRQRVPRIDSVDLRFGDRVFVKPVADGRAIRASRAAAGQ